MLYSNNQNDSFLSFFFSLNNEDKYNLPLTNEDNESFFIINTPIIEPDFNLEKSFIISINEENIDKSSFNFDGNLLNENNNSEKGSKEENKNDKNKINLFNVKMKRGRKRMKNEKKKTHDKNSSDNLLRKIQVHYLTFIISYINEILQNLDIKLKFNQIDYKFKMNINKKYLESLKSKTIGQIICNKISPKYKYKEDNALIYEKIEDTVIKRVLSENYLTLFRNIYYNSCYKINLREYGLDKTIILSKQVKMFKDLIKKIDSKNENKININKIIKKRFFTSTLNIKYLNNIYYI